MGWRQFIPAAESEARRQRRTAERTAMQRYRELQQSQHEGESLRTLYATGGERRRVAKGSLLEFDLQIRATHEVDQFENYLELLVSVHKDCGDAWDWQALAKAAPPRLPARGDRHESAARAEMEAYKPGFFEKLFGGDKKRLAQLNNVVERCRTREDAEYIDTVRQHQALHDFWTVRRKVASRILAGDVSAYSDALEHAVAFDEMAAFRTRVTVSAAETDVIALACEMTDEEVVPSEDVKLTATGKLSTKAMPAARYWALYQDHVCSCALRVAREAFAVLPVSRAIVNIGKIQTNTGTGHQELVTLLAVHFARDTLAALNLGSIDPSDSMTNFPHRMKFKKTSGFGPVPPITPDEQWVTT